MPKYYIKVKDAQGVIKFLETEANTALKSGQELLAMAANALGSVASSLIILDHGKKKED